MSHMLEIEVPILHHPVDRQPVDEVKVGRWLVREGQGLGREQALLVLEGQGLSCEIPCPVPGRRTSRLPTPL